MQVIDFLFPESLAAPPLFVKTPDFFIRSFAGVTKYCRWIVAFLSADSSASEPLFVRGIQFLHALLRGNGGVLLQ